MPIRATVVPLSEPGHAILRLADLDASPEGLTLSIQRQQGPDSHLADDGWRRTEAWLLPSHVERNEGALDFHLGPEICDCLAGVSTVRLRVKEPDIGVVGATVVAWPPMLTSGAADPNNRSYDETVRLRRAAAAPPPPVEIPEPPPVVERPPELTAVRDPQPVAVAKPRSSLPAWSASVLVVLLLTGAAYYVYEKYFPDEHAQASAAPAAETPAPPATPRVAVATASPPPAKSIRDTVAEYLATKPTPEAMLAKGREYAQAGQASGAFLVWRRAAEAGNSAAEMEVASFYDPLSPQPKTGFTPDGARAVEWYERSALNGQAEAQRKLGLLYQKGGAGLAADPAKARSWLQQAAAQNDAEAKKALDALPK